MKQCGVIDLDGTRCETMIADGDEACHACPDYETFIALLRGDFEPTYSPRCGQRTEEGAHTCKQHRGAAE